MMLNRWTRGALAVISGLLLAASFPKIDLNLLVWIALVPLLYALEGESPASVFGYAWLQGFACAVASLYWIVVTLHNFTSLALPLAVAPMLVLAAIVAIYGAVAFWAAEYSAARLKLPIVVTLPIAWTALEWVRTYFPIGFPWNLLGYAAYRNLDLIQFAEFTGVYGVSALIVLFNAVIYIVLFSAGSRRVQRLSLGTVTILLAAALIFGSLRIRQITNAPASGSINFAMVQGDIPQSIKWDPKFLQSSFQVYLDESRRMAQDKVDLIVWPEAAAEFLFQPDNRYPEDFADDAVYRQRLLDLAARINEPILFGAPALGVQDQHVGFYNRAYLVSASGEVESWYDKMQLVPFGEYVPLRSVFGYFVKRVVSGFGDMLPGRVQTLFEVKGAKLGVLICYESIFPELSRTAAKRGADILVNITNDAWYGDSSAPYQLLAMTAMRSVETKEPVVRVANTGISAIIEPTGAITARTPIFQRDAEVQRVFWRPERTVYTEIGDVFAELCFAAAVLLIVLALFHPRNTAPARSSVRGKVSANGLAR